MKTYLSRKKAATNTHTHSNEPFFKKSNRFSSPQGNNTPFFTAAPTIQAKPSKDSANNKSKQTENGFSKDSTTQKPIVNSKAISSTNGNSIQRMKIRGSKKSAVVSSKTRKKHVAWTFKQAAKAKANHTSTTFVTSESALTKPVNDHAHNFTEATKRKSGRVDITANVKIYQWKKAENGVGNPVTKTINGKVKPCEIGAVKTGDDKISITHFMLKK